MEAEAGPRFYKQVRHRRRIPPPDTNPGMRAGDRACRSLISARPRPTAACPLQLLPLVFAVFFGLPALLVPPLLPAEFSTGVPAAVSQLLAMPRSPPPPSPPAVSGDRAALEIRLP